MDVDLKPGADKEAEVGKTTRSLTMPIAMTLVLLAAMSVSALTGCGDAKSKNGGSSASGGKSGSGESTPAVLGQRVSVGHWDIAITRATTETNVMGNVPPAGKEFMLVGISLQNSGTKTAGVRQTAFKLVDRAGKRYPLADVDIPGWAYMLDSLPPGALSSTLIAFELPPGITNRDLAGFDLVFEPGPDLPTQKFKLR